MSEKKFSGKANEEPSKYRQKNVGNRRNSEAYATHGPGTTGAVRIPKKRDN